MWGTQRILSHGPCPKEASILPDRGRIYRTASVKVRTARGCHCSFLPCLGGGAGSPSCGQDVGNILLLFWSPHNLLFAKTFLIQYDYSGFQPGLPIRITWAVFKHSQCPGCSPDQCNQHLWGCGPVIRNFKFLR